MEVIIAFVVSLAGAMTCSLDFCTLFTFTSIATTIYKSWLTYAYDKAAKR